MQPAGQVWRRAYSAGAWFVLASCFRALQAADALRRRHAALLCWKFLILGFGGLAASTPYLGVILLGVVLSWLKSAASLAEQFNALAENDEELKAELA